jgi:DUF4097 and DUF4098 domain-containing protein YvlB
MNMRKVVLWLFVIMISAFSLGTILLATKGLSIGNWCTATRTYSITVDEKGTAETENLESIDISGDIAVARVILTEDKVASFHLYGSISTNCEDCQPTLTVARSENTLNVDVKWPKIQRRIVQSTLKLDVHLPKGYGNSLMLATTSGSIESEKLSIKTVQFTTQSGDIVSDEIQAKTIELRNVSGRTTLNGNAESFRYRTVSGEFSGEWIHAKNAVFIGQSSRVRVKGKFEDFKFISKSGGLISEKFSAQKTEIDVISGSVRIKGPISEYFSFKSVSGELTAEDLGTENVRIKTTSGKMSLSGLTGDLNFQAVSGELNAQYDAYKGNVDASSISGNVHLNLPETAEFALEFDTTSGALHLGNSFPLVQSGTMNRGRVTGYVRSKANKIKASTVSGSLRID